MEQKRTPVPQLCVLMALSPTPVPPMFQKLGDAGVDFEIPSREEEVRGGVTEYREIVENNPAYLYCDTNAIPPPELSWYREGQPLSAADGVSVLQGSLGCRGVCQGGRGVCRQGSGAHSPRTALTCPGNSPGCCLLCDRGPPWTLAAFCKLGLDALCLFEGRSRIPLCLWFLERAHLWASRSVRSWDNWPKLVSFSAGGGGSFIVIS